MGQTCESACHQPNSPHVSEVNENYLKLLQSKQVDQEFPLEIVPETVRERIQLLNLKVDYKNSELWKYQEPIGDKMQGPGQSLVIYTLINRDDIKQHVQSSPEPEQVILATSQPPLSSNQGGQNQAIGYRFDPHHFTVAAIFLFKQKQNPQVLTNPYAEDAEKLQFEQFYFGSVNQKMQLPNAKKIFKNGEYYDGNIKDNLLEGKGIGRNALGNHFYEGSWSKNRPQSHGVQELDGKFKFEGDFNSGKWNGRGKLTLINTAYPIRLQGNFVNGTLQGQGTIRNNYGDLIYEGEFKNGREHGKGTWYGSNKDKYEGDFVYGRKQGEGRFTFGSGNIYQGSFKNGRPQGKGVLTKGGIESHGYWFNGENILISKSQQQ